MAEPDAPELEATAVANGSGPPEDSGAKAVSGNKGGEEMKDSEEKKIAGERKDSEENKDGEENGVGAQGDKEEGKEERTTEDVDMVEAEDEKMAEAGDVKDEGKVSEGGENEKGPELGEENDVKEEKDNGNAEKKVDENKEAEVPKRKRARGQRAGEKGDRKEKKEGGTKVKELMSTPVASSIERPVRERKTVERLVEVIEKEPNKGFLIEKGRGTPLKDIPNVSYKLARKKPADLKLLHQTLFGRRGKAVNFKTHILQFSGFAWHENDEKQRAKVKEKLDKYVKDTLVDLCDLFDIPVSRATKKKEDLVVMLLDFMVAPHPTTDVVLAEMEQQSTKSRKRKRVAKGTASRSVGDTSVKPSRKKRTTSEGTPNSKGKSAHETEDEDEEEEEEDNENGVHDEDEALKHSDSDVKEIESEEASEEDEDDNEGSKKVKRDMKKSSKRRGSATKEKMVGTSSKKAPPLAAVKSPSKHQADENNDVGAKVFTRKKKNVDVPKKKSSPKPDKKERATGKRGATIKGKSEESKQSGPSKEELRKTICEILKEVDFNTATFTDILKLLAARYKMDLTPRKSAIKLMIQEELTKLADEAEENEDDEDDEEAEKGNNQKPTELEA